MNKKLITLLVLILAMTMVFMTACGGKDDNATDGSDETAVEETTGEEEATEEEKATEEKKADEDGEEKTEHLTAVKTIEGLDAELGPRLPLMIESITLYDDGSVAIVPVDELRKNELEEGEEAVYPFADSGKVADVYVTDYGNGGYRTIIALMRDGSVSAVNGRALVEDHIFAVMDDVAGRDNFVSVETRTDESGTVIVGTTESGEEVILDYSLNFDSPQ